MDVPPLDIRDISIIDALPVYDMPPVTSVLSVGCGEGRLDFHLAQLGYAVHATDIIPYKTWQDVITSPGSVRFSTADIFTLDSFPVSSAPVVICSEVLEHIPGYALAFKNLLALATTRLIITVPWRTSFNVRDIPPPVGHCNHWDDKASKNFRDIHEFAELCCPFQFCVSKMRTKPRDVKSNQYDYLLIVDKRQQWCTTP